ncbi:MAG: hypothetical protein GWP08_14680 [Nitrospiraceae bacterium]|nr:hypothetical protein [Nitrospiraceae bacterium]
MAVKYVRDDGHEHGIVSAPGGMLRRIGRAGPKRRLIIIYMGVAGFAVLLILTQVGSNQTPLRGSPIETGEGIILSKSVEDGAYTLSIQVLLDDGERPEGIAVTDEETWNRLAVGDRIGLRFQRNRSGSRVRIHQTGVVALNR